MKLHKRFWGNIFLFITKVILNRLNNSHSDDNMVDLFESAQLLKNHRIHNISHENVIFINPTKTL